MGRKGKDKLWRFLEAEKGVLEFTMGTRYTRTGKRKDVCQWMKE